MFGKRRLWYEGIQAGSLYYFTPVARHDGSAERWFPHDLETSRDIRESNVA
jgi:hypothetical protein